MKKITFPAVMIGTAIISGIITAAFAIAYHMTNAGWLLSLSITAGTICYHFAMRLVVGSLVPNTFDYRSRWFQPRAFEAALYKKLRLKGWKDKMPTYNPRLFSLQHNTLAQIVQNICQAEVVHETIMVLSFVPMVFSLVWDSFWVFTLTSLAAACFDGLFVMLQRYNRPRLIRLLEKQRKKGCAYDPTTH